MKQSQIQGIAYLVDSVWNTAICKEISSWDKESQELWWANSNKSIQLLGHLFPNVIFLTGEEKWIPTKDTYQVEIESSYYQQYTNHTEGGSYVTTRTLTGSEINLNEVVPAESVADADFIRILYTDKDTPCRRQDSPELPKPKGKVKVGGGNSSGHFETTLTVFKVWTIIV